MSLVVESYHSISKYMSYEMILSLVLSAIISAVVSFSISYFFWKRPVSTEFILTKSLVENEDSDDEIYYKIGHDNSGWLVKKIISGLLSSGESFRSYADKKNNPKVITEPTTLEEVKALSYRDIK